MALTPEQRRQRARRTNLMMAYAYAAASTKGWTPAQLATGASAWAWYDFSDLSTMFQDAAGTTPVTAATNPIGLILDKAGSVGAELITPETSGFTGTPTQFTSAGLTVTTTGGVLRGTLPADNTTRRFDVIIPTTAGRTYRVAYTVNSNNGVNLSAWVNTTHTGANRGAGTFSDTVYIVATAATATLRFYPRTPSGTQFAGDFVEFSSFSVREVTGAHATQGTAPARPLYQIDGSGRGYAAFDGTDDSLATGTINPGSVDKAQVFAGIRKLSDAAQGVVAELGASIVANNGAFLLAAPNSAAGNYNFASKGTTQVDNIVTTYTAPITNVITGLGDISGPSNIIRVNGAQVGSVATSQGTGNYLSGALNIGQRSGGTLRFNGWITELIVRFSTANLDSATIANAEAYINRETGAF